MTQLQLGFASFQDGTFELIVSDQKNYKEITLKGLMEGNPSLEEIDAILPTCVFVNAESPELPSGWCRMLLEANASLTREDGFINDEADGYLLEAVDQIADPAQDDDCTLYLFTQSQLLKLMRTITQKETA
jgi:hypothetical protein